MEIDFTISMFKVRFDFVFLIMLFFNCNIIKFIILPILNQYLSGGFQASLYLVLYSIIINLFGYSDKMNGYSFHDFLDLFESGTDNESEEGEK